MPYNLFRYEPTLLAKPGEFFGEALTEFMQRIVLHLHQTIIAQRYRSEPQSEPGLAEIGFELNGAME